MNFLHRRLCRSSRWKNRLEKDLLPWVLENVDLGRNALEIGPGPGLTTDVLRNRVQHLTCIEVDSAYAGALARRLSESNVTVLCEDATKMSLTDGGFDAAVSLTMLHHVPSPALQDRLFAEVARVLRPGGIFAGVDSVYNTGLRLFHLFDTFVPIDPATLRPRLEAAGFSGIRIDVDRHAFRFRAHR